MRYTDTHIIISDNQIQQTMPETRFGEMAGTGIVKSGTMISVDPVQKLRIVTVTERLTVPEDASSPNSAASVGYVRNLLSQGGRFVAGDGLSVSNGVISVQQDLQLRHLTLTHAPEQPNDAATVAYVMNNLTDKTSKIYVDTGLEDIRESYVTKEYMEEVLSDVSSKSSVDRLVSGYESSVRNYVDTAAATLASNLAETDATIKELASFTYVDSVVGKLASVDEVDSLIAEACGATTTRLNAQLNQEYVSKTELSQYTTGMPTKSYVDDTVKGLVSESQLEDATSELAGKSYVDSAVAGLATTAYVDDALGTITRTTTCKCQMIATQYVQPVESETVVVRSEAAYLLIDPETPLDSISIDFTNVQSEQACKFTLATSRDIEDVNFKGLTLTGQMRVPQSTLLTAGSSQSFLYSPSAKAWFVL